MPLRLTLDIFSGRPNPSVVIAGLEEQELLRRLQRLRTTRRGGRVPPIPPSLLGYRGVTIDRLPELPRPRRGGPFVDDFICGSTGPFRRAGLDQRFFDLSRGDRPIQARAATLPVIAVSARCRQRHRRACRCRACKRLSDNLLSIGDAIPGVHVAFDPHSVAHRTRRSRGARRRRRERHTRTSAARTHARPWCLEHRLKAVSLGLGQRARQLRIVLDAEDINVRDANLPQAVQSRQRLEPTCSRHDAAHRQFLESRQAGDRLERLDLITLSRRVITRWRRY